MITHQEAEILTSARQDAPLDPLVERELQAHLAICDQCRAFAAATERLTAGLKHLPTLPASPRVRREVMEQARRGRSPFTTWLGGIAPNMSMGSALATIATIAVIGFFSWFAMDRIFLDSNDNGGDGVQIAAVPTTGPVQRTAVQPNETQPAADTAAGSTETETAAVTATEPPTVAETPPPTEVATETRVATETETAAAQEKASTTETQTEAATEPPTEPPTVAASETATDAVVDLTGTENAADSSASRMAATESTVAALQIATADVPVTAPATQVPTSVATPPTVAATVAPIAPSTPVPTAASTPQPTAEATPTPTSAATPTPTDEAPPAIEPIDSTETPTEVPTQTEIATTEATETATEAVEETSPPIEPADGTEGATNVAEVEQADTSETEAAIEPIGDAASTPGVGGAVSEISATDTGESESLLDASDSYTGIAGDPAGRLALTKEGRLEFVNVPDGALFTSNEGFTLTSPDAQPAVVQFCTDTYCEPALDAPDDASWQGDVAMGVADGNGYVLRKYADRSEIIVGTPSGTQLVDAAVVLEFGPTGSPYAVYDSEGVLYAWMQTNQWVQMSSGGAQLLSGGYTDPIGVRFAPRADDGPMMGYFSNGSLIIATTAAPDAPLLVFDAGAVDFDISPDGQRIAITDGTGISIYDRQGIQQIRYDGGDATPGSLIWLRSGIVWVDTTTSQLYQIPDTAAD